MFTVIKKETAWREVGHGVGGEGRIREAGRLHICPCRIWGSLPTLTRGLFWIFGVRCQWDFDFLGRITCENDQG